MASVSAECGSEQLFGGLRHSCGGPNDSGTADRHQAASVLKCNTMFRDHPLDKPVYFVDVLCGDCAKNNRPWHMGLH